MANLWDIPPKPEHGDTSPETTFAAVGRALSAWERVDLELSVIYATLLGITPSQAIRCPEYRNESLFVGRVAVIERAWERYTRVRHDQAIEGDFDKLIADARGLSFRRNDIAHGIVVPLWDEHHPEEFVLLPAMYRDKRFSPSGEPDFIYSSVEISRFTEIFTRLILRCVQVHHMVAHGIDPCPELRLSPCPGP